MLLESSGKIAVVWSWAVEDPCGRVGSYTADPSVASFRPRPQRGGAQHAQAYAPMFYEVGRGRFVSYRSLRARALQCYLPGPLQASGAPVRSAQGARIAMLQPNRIESVDVQQSERSSKGC